MASAPAVTTGGRWEGIGGSMSPCQVLLTAALLLVSRFIPEKMMFLRGLGTSPKDTVVDYGRIDFL